MNTIAENIAQRRKELGMTQKELAEKLNVSDKTLSRWETGKQIPDALTVRAIADALNMTISELYGMEQTEEHAERAYTESQKRRTPGKKIWKLAAAGIAGVAAIMTLVICAANHNLSSKVSYRVEEVPMYALTSYDHSVLDWVQACDVSGKEIHLLSKQRYDSETGEDIACYLIYLPHGYKDTKLEVRYQLGLGGRVLKLQVENTAEIIDDNYYLCYIEVVYNQEDSLYVQTYLDGERVDHSSQGNASNVNWGGFLLGQEES